MEVNFSVKCETSETIAQCRSIDNLVKVFNNQIIADARLEQHRNVANNLGNVLNFVTKNKDLIVNTIGLVFPQAAQKVKNVIVFVEQLKNGELPIESEQQPEQPEQPEQEQPEQ